MILSSNSLALWSTGALGLVFIAWGVMHFLLFLNERTSQYRFFEKMPGQVSLIVFLSGCFLFQFSYVIIERNLQDQRFKSSQWVIDATYKQVVELQRPSSSDKAVLQVWKTDLARCLKSISKPNDPDYCANIILRSSLHLPDDRIELLHQANDIFLSMSADRKTRML